MDNLQSDGMVMSTLESLDNPIIDDYDIDEMEEHENIANEEGDNVPEPTNFMDYPSFNDVSLWFDNEPVEFYLSEHDHVVMGSLRMGELFNTKEDAIYACQKYSVLNRVEFWTSKSDKERLVLKCRQADADCPWKVRIYKKKNTGMWKLTTYDGNHTCGTDVIAHDNVHMTRHFLARDIMSVIHERLRWGPNDVKAAVQLKYGYQIRYFKAWQAKQQAIVNLFGEWQESFAKLPHYMEALKESNPGTAVFWDTTEVDGSGGSKVYLNRVFWAFAPAIQGFSHCRPVLCVDGTHLYGKYKGVLLVAVACDANNHIFPLAFALVESENNSSWDWFMSCIRVGVTDRSDLCVISDRHKGLIHAMRAHDWSPPRAHHRFCIRHLQSNFNSKVGDSGLKSLFGTIAYQNQLCKFQSKFAELENLMGSDNPNIAWIQSIPLAKWSFAHDNGGRRWGVMTTNMSECFNNVLKGARDLPITAIVEFTFKQSNRYFYVRRDMYHNCVSMLAPKIDRILCRLKEKAQVHKTEVFDRANGLYQVTTPVKRHKFRVSLKERSCECGKWELLHYPCSHVLAVCIRERINDYTQFVDSAYSLVTYHNTWSYTFQPVPDERYWSDYNGPLHIPNPRFKRTQMGRNPSVRRHNEMDQSQASTSASQSQGTSTTKTRVQKCSVCHVVGHNRKKCPTQM